MCFQVGFFRIVEGFQKSTFAEGRACVANIWGMHPASADFLYEIGAMFIAKAVSAMQNLGKFPGAFFPTQGRCLYRAVHSILTGIE